MLKTTEINIRDPYILPYQNKYYLYGTRSKTCWSNADGFDCYISSDLENWEGPIEIFHKPKDFFATEKYWAPECNYYNGSFYIFCTFASPNQKTGMYVLKSERPDGPYEVYGERLTPEDWACIDGTFYVEDEKPYLVYSHTFEDIPEGEYLAVELTEDLSRCAGEPIRLFSAIDAVWAQPIPFAKERMGIDGEIYLTDGPCVVPLAEGGLGISWSSWSKSGYAVGLAVSESGKLKGPWRQQEAPIYQDDGGHGMFFKTLDGEMHFVMHSPDTHFEEHPILKKAKIKKTTVILTD